MAGTRDYAASGLDYWAQEGGMKTALYDFDDVVKRNLNVPIGGWLAHASDDNGHEYLKVWNREPTDSEIDEFLREFK
jgi:hypothetical protein